MSGHSHFKKIKHQKAVTDAKVSQGFSKVAREITVAAGQGNDPDFNSKLRIAIEKAREINMPAENIERAIKRGTGEDAGENLEEVLYEAYGPGGTAIIIEGITDNKNRSFGQVRQILNERGGKLVGEGAVRWMFERKGCITLNPKFQIPNSKSKEELEMAAIEAGAEDFYWRNEELDIYIKIEELEKIKKFLENKGIKVESASLDWVPKEMVKVEEKDKEANQKLFEELDENDAVQEIYSNLKL